MGKRRLDGMPAPPLLQAHREPHFRGIVHSVVAGRPREVDQVGHGCICFLGAPTFGIPACQDGLLSLKGPLIHPYLGPNCKVFQPVLVVSWGQKLVGQESSKLHISKSIRLRFLRLRLHCLHLGIITYRFIKPDYRARKYY